MICLERFLRGQAQWRHNNCSVQKKVHTHFHRGWPHDLTKHHCCTKSQTSLTALLTLKDRCVGGRVWESLPLWRQWWEITNTRGLMYSFQGQVFSPTRLIWWITLCAALRSGRWPIRMPRRLPRGYCGWILYWPLWHFKISHDGRQQEAPVNCIINGWYCLFCSPTHIWDILSSSHHKHLPVWPLSSHLYKRVKVWLIQKMYFRYSRK